MKFRKPREITARYHIVTPMFLGGADQSASGIRSSAVKGALRFWWRALAWGGALDAAGGDQEHALIELHDREARLFGLAAGDNTGGQSALLLSVAADVFTASAGPLFAEGSAYLLGQGLSKYDASPRSVKTTRNRIVKGEFTVCLRDAPRANSNAYLPDDRELALVADALTALGLFGGLGSRARHGVGSVAIQSLCVDGAEVKFENLDSVRNFIARLNFSAPEAAPLTAFTRGTRIDVSSHGKKPAELFKDFGNRQQLYRSWGQKGKVNGAPARQLFKDDHDLVLSVGKGTRVDKLPRRAVFGLPHNYFFSSTKAKVDINVSKNGARRASPLLTHIHQFPDRTAACINVLFTTAFLPQDAEITLNPQQGQSSSVRSAGRIDYGVITAFLDEFSGKEVLHHGG